LYGGHFFWVDRFQLGLARDFDIEEGVRWQCGPRLLDAPPESVRVACSHAGDQVVVLDHGRIRQVEAVIGAAAAPHSVFLEMSPPGSGFAGVGELEIMSGQARHEVCGDGCDAA
jgi:hypothetical protein